MAMLDDVVLQQVPLDHVWQTVDPFLFCVHHDDDYPEGDEELGPCAPLVGRTIGTDFSGRDGWSMYHGSLVPGFPQHPHRGFETISFMRKGYMDHADSLGAAARFGRGDVQWMTAGSASSTPRCSRCSARPRTTTPSCSRSGSICRPATRWCSRTSRCSGTSEAPIHELGSPTPGSTGG